MKVATIALFGVLFFVGTTRSFSVQVPKQMQSAPVPVIWTTPAQNGAVIVKIEDASARATIFYTVDGTTPTTS